MKKQTINLETIDNDPIFENDTVVATRSEGLRDGILEDLMSLFLNPK